jgi:hypothetical protein
VTRKSIATNMAVVSCDVCGRTLLRGENADIFLVGGSRRTVCELCTSRAVHEGWIREGLDDVSSSRGPERGRSFLQRLRHRRERPEREPAPERAPRPDRRARPAAPGAHEHHDPPYGEDPVLDEHLHGTGPEPAAPAAAAPAHAPAPAAHAPHHPAPAAAPAYATADHPADAVGREPRSVHAIPTNAQMKIARALEVFNAGSYPRTVAGVSRSLGAPIVAARPSATEGSIVTIVVGWELSWYRYEVDLGDEAAGVRVTAQGSELSELEPADQRPNAAADEHGQLHLVAGRA